MMPELYVITWRRKSLEKGQLRSNEYEENVFEIIVVKKDCDNDQLLTTLQVIGIIDLNCKEVHLESRKWTYWTKKYNTVITSIVNFFLTCNRYNVKKVLKLKIKEWEYNIDSMPILWNSSGPIIFEIAVFKKYKKNGVYKDKKIQIIGYFNVVNGEKAIVFKILKFWLRYKPIVSETAKNHLNLKN